VQCDLTRRFRPHTDVIGVDEPHQTPRVVDTAKHNPFAAGRQLGHQAVGTDRDGRRRRHLPQARRSVLEGREVPRPHTTVQPAIIEPAHRTGDRTPDHAVMTAR